MKKLAIVLVAAAVLVGGLAAAGIYAYAGAYGINMVLRRAVRVWVEAAPDDPRLSAAMRLALSDRVPEAVPAPFEWRLLGAGFEVAELPVLADGAEVDRLLLARVDPARHRFVVRSAPAGDHALGDWMEALGAVLVINGSYFSRRGAPVTPLVSDGAPLGPERYEGRHGAFVASAAAAAVRDLKATPWPAAFAGARDAMVSFPLLIARDGSDRVEADRHWLANRSFVGEDSQGRIILGTTAEAFFSLDRLAAFLRRAPLGLTQALNLDGGPVACQGIAYEAYRRDFCGDWELNARGGRLRLLQPLIWDHRSSMPIVLAVLAK